MKSNGNEDYFKAIELLRKATSLDKNNGEAFYYQGFLYQYGYGVDQDFKSAFTHYKYPLYFQFSLFK